MPYGEHFLVVGCRSGNKSQFGVGQRLVASDNGEMARGADWGTWLTTFVVGFTVTYALWTAVGWDLGDYTTIVNELADYPVLLGATVLMLRASRVVESRNLRRGWRLLAIAFVALILTNAFYIYIALVLHEAAFASVGDLFWLAFFPCALLGLLSFPERLGTRSEKITFALDAATLMVCGGTLILRLAILPVAGSHSAMEVALASYYPLTDMVLAIAIFAVLFRTVPKSARSSLCLLAVAFFVLFVSDLWYCRYTLAGDHPAVNITDSFWTISYSAVAIAAHLQYRAATAPSLNREHAHPARSRLSSVLPHTAVAATVLVLVAESVANWSSSTGTLVASVTMLVALVGARQVIAIRENTRILAENTTRDNEARFRALVQQSSDVISIVDSQRIVRYVSPSIERVFGSQVEELEGTPLLERIHPDDREIVREFFDRIERAPNGSATTTWRQRHHDGRWLHVEVVGTNGLADAKVNGVVLNARDVTDRFDLEREREQARAEGAAYQAQLLQAQKMDAIGRLAGGVAHDMNNALAAIVVTADCLADGAPTPEVKADAEAILLSARRAADLTRNLLGFARRGDYRSEIVAPETLVTSVVELVARTLPKTIKVETSFGADLQNAQCDSAQLSHALVNLCINAADAMNGTGVLGIGAHLRRLDTDAARTRGLAEGDYVLFSVCDTGTGMDDATRERVFEPFFTTKEPGRGTGLGLAMVYGTVKRHHGAVEVESKLGEGSTFRIYLPASTRPVEEMQVERRSIRTVTTACGRVLLVDDEPLLRSTTQRLLERKGFEVMVASHGRDGLDVLAREDGAFDVVLLDMAMPVMAGPEMFRRARAAYPDLRILLTSGFTSSTDAQALLAEGAYGMVTKPFTPAVLLDAISMVMREQRVDGVQSIQ